MKVEYYEATERLPERIELELPRSEAIGIQRAEGVRFIEASDGKGRRFFLMNAAPDMIENGDEKEIPFNYFIKLSKTRGPRGQDYTVRITDSAYVEMLNKSGVSHTLEDAMIEIKLV